MIHKCRICLAIVAAGLLAGLLPDSVLCAVAEAPAGAVTLAGKITVTQRNGLEPLEATLTTGAKQVYSIVMDEKGKSLGRVMNREEAEILAHVSEKDGQQRATVVGYVDPRLTAAHELWRRMRCNACVVFPGTVNATPPKDLHGAKPVTGRWWTYEERFLAWTRDSRFLWLASDSRLVQVDLEAAKAVRSFGRQDGLPDQWVYQLASDGQAVWMVYKGGVAVLDVARGRIRDLPALRSAYACVLAGADGTWIMTDKGTYRFSGADAEPEVLPALPTAAQIRRAVEQGVWIPHWKRRTAHFMATPAAVGGKLYVNSYGDIYGLAGKEWKKAAPDSWELTASAGRAWFLNKNGLGQLKADTGELAMLPAPDIKAGRPARLMAADDAMWMVTEPLPPATGQPPVGGGLSRLDITSGKWQSWSEINGKNARQIVCMGRDGQSVWAVAEAGEFREKPAHPGMTYVKRTVFEASGFVLHRYDGKSASWTSLPLEIKELEKRLICGQDGTRNADGIVPRAIREISPGPDRVFAMANLLPAKYFGGFWPTVLQVAARTGDSWTAAFDHHPGQLNLQGQQPLVLNISNGELIQNPLEVGQRVLEAVGHDGVLGLFMHGNRHWALTEGRAGFYDAAAGQWRALAETDFRYYWHAATAVEVGGYLYVGSDRGLVSRLSLTTGEFEWLKAFKDRSIVRIVSDGGNGIKVFSGQAPLGQLPVQLEGRLALIDADAAVFDGKEWKPLGKDEAVPPALKPAWFFRQLEKRNDFDKSQGNFLFGPSGQAEYYLKEVFFPQFLCPGEDGKHLWLSLFDGLMRLDLER